MSSKTAAVSDRSRSRGSAPAVPRRGGPPVTRACCPLSVSRTCHLHSVLPCSAEAARTLSERLGFHARWCRIAVCSAARSRWRNRSIAALTDDTGPRERPRQLHLGTAHSGVDPVDLIPLSSNPNSVVIGARIPFFPASFTRDTNVRVDCGSFGEAQIMRRRASTVVALVTSIAWVTTADAQTGAVASTDEVERPIAAFEVFPASFDLPAVSPSTFAGANDQVLTGSGTTGVGLGVAFGQAIGFSIVQHLFRLSEEKTRRELGGPFFSDWFKSVSHLGGDWDDGGKIFANYVAHPMGGAVYAHIYRQNDRRRRELEFGEPGYGGMALRALTVLGGHQLTVRARAAQRSLHRQCRYARCEARWHGGTWCIRRPSGSAWMVGEM